jgi:hypothetical protein
LSQQTSELLRTTARPQTNTEFVITPAARPSKKSHNYFVVSRRVGCLETPMGRIGQIAVGALAAVCISGASAGMDSSRFNAHQSEIAARQLERLYADAKIDLVGAKLVEGTQSVIRSLLGSAD